MDPRCDELLDCIGLPGLLKNFLDCPGLPGTTLECTSQLYVMIYWTALDCLDSSRILWTNLDCPIYFLAVWIFG